MPRRQSKFLFACARLARETTHRNPKTDSTLRFRPLASPPFIGPRDRHAASADLRGTAPISLAISRAAALSTADALPGRGLRAALHTSGMR